MDFACRKCFVVLWVALPGLLLEQAVRGQAPGSWRKSPRWQREAGRFSMHGEACTGPSPSKNLGMTPQFTDAQKRGKRCTGKARAAERVLKRILTFAEQRWNEA